MSSDCWENRKAGMRCNTCVFFVPKRAQKDIEKSEEGCERATQSPRGDIGRCRRNAPTMKGFPVVFEQDWCGEHRLDENKI